MNWRLLYLKKMDWQKLMLTHVSKKEDIAKHFKEAEIPYKCVHKNIGSVKSADIKTVEGHVNVIIDMEYIKMATLFKI